MTGDRPSIAVLLDENTSGDGRRYEASKGYFTAVHAAGGMPFGIPYLIDMVPEVLRDFDGLVCVGGRFAYPDDWYLEGMRSAAPESPRLPVERALMQGFLDAGKPVLGICAGMQMLACLHGCRLAPEVRLINPQAMQHDQRDLLHDVAVAPDSLLGRIVRTAAMRVNTLHREALAQTSGVVKVSAVAEDGIIEAVEVPSRRFAVGVQWHQEAFAEKAHPGNAVFAEFVRASRAPSPV